jgi:murein DD-endopeptidase MepM/ murein hydrolase activator NlpD
MRTKFAAAFMLALALAGPAAAAEPTIRAYPAGPLHAWPLDSVRGVQSLLLQNAAVINTTGAPMTVASVRFELLRGGQVIETRVLTGSDVERLAKVGASVQGSGMIDVVGFQFGDVLGKPAAKLPATPTLAPGEALLITSQVFSWSGERDALRVTIAPAGPDAPSASLTIPVQTAQPEPRYRFPLKGRWYVQAAPSFNTHHRWAVPEEFALDMAQLGAGGLSYRTDGMTMSDYYAYGAPVYAAADGEVVKVISDQIEDLAQFRRPGESQEDYLTRVMAWQNAMLVAGPDAPGGNAVVIRHAWGEYSVYAHLKPGAAPVAVGQQVKAGDLIGFLGSSGSSTEPHLHFHVCDGPSVMTCVGKPAAFSNVENPYAFVAGAIQSGDVVVAK